MTSNAGDLYKVDTYKLILDGTIESRSASMMEPYVEDGSVVAPLLEGKELQDLFVRAASEGFRHPLSRYRRQGYP